MSLSVVNHLCPEGTLNIKLTEDIVNFPEEFASTSPLMSVCSPKLERA